MIKMIDITDKAFTKRTAEASIRVVVPQSVLKKIKNKKLPKGDCCEAACIAGILAAKNTAAMIPLCHPIRLTHVAITFNFLKTALEIRAIVKACDATGVEMEALSACAMAALTIYDMAKTETQNIVITDLKLLKKTGGKSDYKIKK